MSDGHLPRSEDPCSGTCGRDRSVLLPDHRTRGKSTSRTRSMTSDTGEPWCAGGDQPSSRGTDWPQAMAGRAGELAGQLAILADGMLTPSATKAHDMTLAGSASFNGEIFLAMAEVERELKGSMAGERINKSFGREVREKETS
jgi:hypothetical protein